LLLFANTTALMFINPFVDIEVACCCAYSDHYICIMALLIHHFLGNKRAETQGKDILTNNCLKLKLKWQVKLCQ
jgi:hypothetical protein